MLSLAAALLQGFVLEWMHLVCILQTRANVTLDLSCTIGHDNRYNNDTIVTAI